MPKISVILTSFNHEEYIREAIDSVLNQTFADFELIIWDDASSDGSWAVINSYTDSRIKAFRNEATKRGIYGINKAISEVATGEYIAIHHSDDAWELDKLEKQAAFLDNHCEIGAVFTWTQIIDENGAKLENNWFDQENKTRWQWLNQLFLEQNHLNHPSVLIRRECYQDVGMYRYGLAQTGDAEMWSRVLIRFPIHVIQERLTKHRLFSDKSNTSGPRIEVAIRISNEWNVLRENYLSITNFEDIVAIFPSLERFRNPEGFDNKFLLAMACLYECKQRSAWQLGLKWLFDLLNDKTRYKKIREFYSFSYMDFIRLTPEFDVYFVECDRQIARWDGQIAEREQSITALQVKVQDLLTGNAWLTSQREAWEKTAAEREQSIAILQAQVQDLLTGNAWLTSQREAWEKVAAEREQSIAALTSRLHETDERLAASDAILNKIRNHWGMRFGNFLSKTKLF
ncbi:MAG: glycosyltransferase [Candidatus Nitrotoga sp.]|nr:glycosyltransferase [Candidatus Nitrotoga sp.]MDO9446829.1 glycosyltransferase [Candidatus Nitrotoga sp.]